MPFGMLGRFAGDRMKEITNALGNGYNAADSQLGGILPGGVAASGKGMVEEIVRDALPGDRKVSGAKIAKKGNAVASHAARGDVGSVAAVSRGGALGAQIREQAVEESLERAARFGLNKGARRIGGVLAPPLGIYDTLNDAKGAYSTALEVTTGKDLDTHIGLAGDKRDAGRGIDVLFPRPEAVMPSDGSIPQITQGTAQNAILQEARARLNHAGSKFNPAQGDWGMTELLYGR